tara:strand:- start:3093 stop:3449 length:357 start_codon:yes stop_codon:yes gene_type:complete
MKHLLYNPNFMRELARLHTTSGDELDCDWFEREFDVVVDHFGPDLLWVEITQPILSSDRIAIVPALMLPDDYCTAVYIKGHIRTVYQTGEDRERWVTDGFDDIDLVFDVTEDSEVYYG